MEEHAVGPSGTSKQAAGPLPKTEGAFDETQIYQGSIAAVIQNRRGKCARTFVAFPTGEVGHHLSMPPYLGTRYRANRKKLDIAPFLATSATRVDKRNRFRFTPTVKPIDRFPTSILQICSSPMVSSSRIDR